MSSGKEKRAIQTIDGEVIDRYETRPGRSRRRSGRGCLGSLLLTAISPFRLVILVGLGIVVAILVLSFANFMSDPLDNFLGTFGFDKDAEPEVADSRTIVLNIQEMAVLETVRSGILITKTVVDSSAAPDAELQISYVGTVKAGVDLSLIGEEDVIVNEDNSLTVVLPPPQITHCDLGKPEIHRWDCRGWAGLQDCSARRDRVQSVAYDRAMEELLETGYELDLLALCSQNAQATLQQLLKSLGYERVQFQQGAEVLPPDESCLVS
jgi:hypothetical protein